MSTFYVQNFGCRATQADGAAIEQQFRGNGFIPSALTAADVVVLNTCAVTAEAEKDARAAIRRVSRANPGCKIVVTGCYAQRAPAEIAAIPGVSQVIGNSHKHNLAHIAVHRHTERDSCEAGSFVPVSRLGSRDSETAEIYVSDIFAHTELLAAPVFDSSNDRTRPNLKVQDGCNNRCSFCIIPSLRGRSRSLSPEEVIRQVNELVRAGYREVVISGINLGRWGRDLEHVAPGAATPAREPYSPGATPSATGRVRAPASTRDVLKFEHLVGAILKETTLDKLRISSVEPMDWTDSFIQLMAQSSRIAKHAHVPMQSGSDAVLRRMHRKYRPWHYREKIEKIRAAMPDAAIGADVMVGFPGETDTEFEETRRMIEGLPLTYLHVFTFSARPGTPAATMPNQVAVRVCRERNKILRELGAKKKCEFMRSFIGKPLEAITLSTVSIGPDGISTDALTDNYLKVKITRRLEPNRWADVLVQGLEGEHLLGTVDDHFASYEPLRQSHTYANFGHGSLA